ncbi:MAG TPA: AAA family ATPase [Candidatus Eremiobacteraceae bacterium]|nr:AAA family ATPase [Candidatus Eremiobacteraceae bacterium]
MYYAAFGLPRDPFIDTADPTYYYETIACASGRRRLAECLISGRGLATVVGPIGVGKTTLCNAVQQDVLAVPSCRAGLILDPTFDGETDFIDAIAASLGIDLAGALERKGAHDLKDRLKRALFESLRDGTQYVLFIDEAQLLPEPLLETLRSMLNYQVDERKLLAVALSGQPELAQHLARHTGLTDRIALWLELEPLAESEAAALLDHRLRIAGFTGARSPFSAEAASTAWRIARGLPRRLTAIARGAMEIASERGSSEVTVADVETARKRVPPDPPSPALTDAGRAEARPLQNSKRSPWAWFAR